MCLGAAVQSAVGRLRFAEVLHIRWLIEFGAGAHVLAEQRRGLPDSYHRAAQPAAGPLFDRLRRDAADVDQAMAAAAELPEA